jgi:hypothetical protein
MDSASSAKQWIAASLIGVLLGAAGCSGSGDGVDESGQPIDDGGGPAPPVTPPPSPPPPPASDFKTIQDTIFTPVCTGCHAGASAPQGLRLDAANSYAMLVGVASSEVPALQRVEAGDAENSYLVHKIEGRAAVGARMPLGGPPLSQANIDLIKQWIVAGAPAPTASSMLSALDKSQTYQLVSSVPAGGEESLPVAQLMLVFNHPVDAALAQSGVFELTASGGDGSLGDGNDITLPLAQISVSLANPAVVYVRPRQSLLPGTYRLTLRGEGATVLADVDNRELDGNGDGVGGDDANVVFTVLEAKR